MKNHQEYAARHGYTYKDMNQVDWINMSIKYDGDDVLVWNDLDSYYTKDATGLESFCTFCFHMGKPIITSRECDDGKRTEYRVMSGNIMILPNVKEDLVRSFLKEWKYHITTSKIYNNAFYNLLETEQYSKLLCSFGHETFTTYDNCSEKVSSLIVHISK